MKIYNKEGKLIKERTDSKAQRFFYNKKLGRIMLKPLTIRLFSRVGGGLLNTRVSKVMIKTFIRKNDINMADYEACKYKSYNDFFTRKKVDTSVDLISSHLISPSDGKLTAYQIDDDALFKIKNSYYSIKDLTGSEAISLLYKGGYCLIFRLSVEDYHRYIYIDEGYKGPDYYIKGKFHTVHPIALRKYNIYKENARSVSMLHTNHFGLVCHIEVGALMVGRIKNHHQYHVFKRGEEKGMFLFGGSTIVLLIEKNQVEIDPIYLEHTKAQCETIVKMGEIIGKKL